MDADTRAFLHLSWQHCWEGLGLVGDPALRDALLNAWDGPGRHYHTTQHLTECLQLLERWQGCADQPAELALALWFHDAVYDPRATDNEARSADQARIALQAAGASRARIEHIRGLILATATHLPTDGDADTRLMLDIDLAILAASPARFAEYEAQIRAEYAWVPEPLYQEKRRAVLAGFHARSPLYLTPAIAAVLEAPARRNLAPFSLQSGR